MTGIRWAVSCGCWKPAAEEWTLAMASIQTEERQRIRRFVFRRDARAALAGRVLIRQAIVQLTGLRYKDIHLDRTEKGKPFLLNRPASSAQFDFNISHDGDYTVLAAETSCLVGVDTMNLNRLPGSSTVSKFFSTMSRQLTDTEWSHVRSFSTETNQLAAFYRYWCLKESYVKSVGVGIGLSLDRLECIVKSPLVSSSVVCDTEILVDGDQDSQTHFEESLLDENHLVCVSLKQTSPKVSSCMEPSRFSVLSSSDLLRGIEPLVDVVVDEWEEFARKPEEPSLHQNY